MCRLSTKKLLIAALAFIFWNAIPAQSQPVQLGFRTLQIEPQNFPQAGSTRPLSDAPLPPAVLTIPAGTVLMVGLSDVISSKDQHPGDSFIAELQHPLVAGGWVIARRGQIVMGRVVESQRAGRVKGTSKISLELEQVILVDGRQIPVQSEQIENSGPTSRGRDVAALAITTAVGAAIGAVCGAKGAAIGTAAGATIGFAGVLMTRGKDIEVGPEKLLAFRLSSPLIVSTENSQHAFWQITSDEYVVPEEVPEQQATPAPVVLVQSSPRAPAVILPEIQLLSSVRPGRNECGK